MSGNKYHDTVKIEFRDLIENIVESNRKHFHLYTIHRILSLGLLIDFTFKYKILDNPEQIGIEFTLMGFGKVMFIVDIESGYCSISRDDKNLLKEFVEKFDINLNMATERKRIF